MNVFEKEGKKREIAKNIIEMRKINSIQDKVMNIHKKLHSQMSTIIKIRSN